jgi:CRP/FNR family transcriptional regulator
MSTAAGKLALVKAALSAYTLPRSDSSRAFDRQHDLMPTIGNLDGVPAVATSTVISIRDLKTHCMTCSMRELCLPVGLEREAMHQLDQLVSDRRRFKRGEMIYGAGEAFAALYAIRLGSCKTTVLAEDGREQVAGYHMPGDLLGLDGIGHERHGCQAIALEDSEVCVLPFGELENLSHRLPPLQKNLHRVLSREIIRDHNVMLLLGSMRAEERLAVFLLNLSHRYHERGYSATEFVLRMTRDEIGSYLGLKLETVSRLFSRFQQEGLIQVQGRAIKLLDTAALRQLAGQHC